MNERDGARQQAAEGTGGRFRWTPAAIGSHSHGFVEVGDDQLERRALLGKLGLVKASQALRAAGRVAC